MPKTASKRVQKRKVAQVKRAHETAPQTTVRKVPLAKRRARPTGPAAIVKNYPWATTIFTVLVILLAGLVLKSARVGPFAPHTAAKTATTKTAVAKTTSLDCTLPKTRTWSSAPAMTIDQSKQYTATIKTPDGNITIALDAKNAPNAVNNFVFLADNNYYCGTYFWRVETPGKPSPIAPSQGPSPLSLIQGGSVTKNGQDSSANPGYSIKDDAVTGDYTPGTVAMANTGQPNTGGAQFFIDIGNESQYFSKTYSIFGTVTNGMNVVKKITPDTVMEGVTIQVK